MEILSPLWFRSLVFVVLLILSWGSKIEDCKSLATTSSPNAHSSFIGCILCQSSFRRQQHQMNRNYIDNAIMESHSKNFSASSPTGAVFHNIYSESIWSKAGGGSGIGSDAGYALVAGHILRLVVYKLGVTSILDAPCGAVSASWTRNTIAALRKDMYCFRYHGVDVVDTVIQTNKATLSNFSDWAQFSVADLSSLATRLPTGYDLILSRDALQHLSFHHIAGALASYCHSESHYLLVGSYLESPYSENKDIATGGCFSINLLEAPFSFPAPLEIFPERGHLGPTSADTLPTKYLLLYSLDYLCRSTAMATFLKRHAR